ncbi:MAG: SDR family NAD(P)-dependent oxidoreductase [Ignavibacteriales bacterium]|nr:MAG: SDR family NAD(P)-dependent oxidoreductase [Ignavibacteriales bacterium]
MDFNNKVVLLTGASSGIGYELAKKISRSKVKLILAARRIDILNELSEQIKTPDNEILTLKCDVSLKDDVTNTIRIAVNAFNKIDIAILNSGTSYRMRLEESSLAKTEEIIKVNAISYLYFFDELIPLMKNKGGVIAGVSSLADSRGYPYSGVYSASKAAVTRILESYRVELKKFNIKVIIIKPGFVRTPMTDKNKFYMPFMIEPSKAADIILKGLRKEKKIIQFPLPTVIGAKLVKLIPNFIFDYFSGKVK